MAFSEILTASWFKYGAIPSIATGVALLIKFNSRPDAKKSDREDWAVGFDLCQVSIFAMLGDGVADAVKSLSSEATRATIEAAKERLAELPWLLIVMLIILLLASYVVRKWGWKVTPASAGTAAAPPKLNSFGLILPLIIGAVYIIGAIIWMGGQRG